MSDETVFKVVKRGKGRRLVSGWIAIWDSDLDLERSYRVGGRTVGLEGTPVMAFATLDHARAFCAADYQRENLVLYEAHGENVREVSVLRALSQILTLRRLLSFWKRPRPHKTYGQTFDAPRGTVACDAITLTRRLAW